MCIVDNFCYFIDLRNGTFIIGIIDVITYLVLLIIEFKDFKTVMGIISKIFYTVHIITSIVMIVAAVKDLPQHCFPWLMTSIILICKFIVKICISVSEFGFEIGYFFEPMILLMFALYFWIVVYSYAAKEYYVDDEPQN